MNHKVGDLERLLASFDAAFRPVLGTLGVQQWCYVAQVAERGSCPKQEINMRRGPLPTGRLILPPRVGTQQITSRALPMGADEHDRSQRHPHRIG